MKPTRLVLAALAAGAVLVAAWSAAAQEARICAVSFLPLNASFGVFFKRWVDAANERGKGVLQIDAVGPEAIPTAEQHNAVKNGVVQMGFIAATFYAGALIEAEVIPLSERRIKELRANGAWAYLDKLHREKLNSTLLMGIGEEVRMHLYTTVPAKTADPRKPMDGIALRSVPIYKPFFDSLGARTVTIVPTEVYTALERGVVQGYGWPRWGIKEMGWLNVTKYQYGPGFLGATCPVIVNQDAWNKMTDAQRKHLTDMALWFDDEWHNWRAGKDV